MNADRSAIVAEIRNRVSLNVSNAVDEKDCVAVCLAASLPRDREELFGFLLNNNLSRIASKCADRISIKEAEWSKLFGKDITFISEVKPTVVTRQEAFTAYSTALESALRCSLTEPDSNAVWKRPTSRLLCYVALYTDSSEDFIAHVLGGLVRSDMRRLDDVRSTMEEEPTDHMLLCQALLALSSSVS